MNNNYKELNIQKSLYRGCGESFAERLEKMDPTENYRGTELGSLDAFQRQLKRFDIQVGGSHSSALEKFFQNGQSAVLFPEYLMRAIRQGMEEMIRFPPSWPPAPSSPPPITGVLPPTTTWRPM